MENRTKAKGDANGPPVNETILRKSHQLCVEMKTDIESLKKNNGDILKEVRTNNDKLAKENRKLAADNKQLTVELEKVKEESKKDKAQLEAKIEQLENKLKNKEAHQENDILLLGGYNNDKSFYSFSQRHQWTKLPDLPGKRTWHGSVVIGRLVLTFGGFDNKTIQQYEISTKKSSVWGTQTKARIEFGICAYNKSEVLIAGGEDHNGEITDTCFLYNFKKTYNEVGTMKSKRKGHVLVNLDGVIYCIGGQNEKLEYLNTIETFDRETKEWKTSDVKLHVPRYRHQAVAHNNFIYIFAGYCGFGDYSNTIEKFDVKTGKIELLDVKLRIARSDFAVGKVRSEVFIFGGKTRNGSTDVVEIFNLKTEQIEEGGKMPFSDYGFTACVL